jgi:hypothetical protein
MISKYYKGETDVKRKKDEGSDESFAFPHQSLEEFIHFINERHSIKLRKESRAPRPWTKDPILAKYFFCNVNREDDMVTRWLATHWRKPHAEDRDLWFALTVFRRGFNNPRVGESLAYPVPWNPDDYVRSYTRFRRKELPFLRPAYMLPGPTGKKGPLGELHAKYIFNPLWENRNYVRPRTGEQLASFYARLNEQHCCGGFYAAQVVADLKYVQLKDADDWWTFVVSGPGSRRGLNRLIGRDKNARWTERAWLKAFRKLEEIVAPSLPKRFHSQDLQNCLCEWDKRERVRLNEKGRVRQYQPKS